MRFRAEAACLYARGFVLAAIVLAILSARPVAAQRTDALPTSEKIDAEEREYFEKAIRKIEPDGVGVRERLPQYMRWFQREMVNDHRIIAFDVDAKWQDEALVLNGFVEFEELRLNLLAFLRALGFERIEDRIETLPSKGLDDMAFGIITASHSLSYDRPEGKKGVVTECLLGEPVYLLKETTNGHFLCHSAEGYLGYVDGRDVGRLTANEFRRDQSQKHATIQADLKTPNGPLLPVGARLELRRINGEHATIRLPIGGEVDVPVGQCEIHDGRPNPRIDRVLSTGHRLLGTKYLWGGKTSAGIDCSGLVQVAFAAEGIHLPRDSNQQVYLGRLTATRWHRIGMRRGDTLYFLGKRGKIIHTAIYLGEDQYLESAGPGVKISSFNPKDDNYVDFRAKRFAFAKRLLE